jgi:SAM-dependent methyltransferase
MDSYTRETQEWLDKRFKQTDAGGVYVAHQPIYGFRQGHCDTAIGSVQMYITTWRIMDALSHVGFSSLLDVGGAEGYKAALARKLFGAQVRSCDLSAEACARAREIFGVEGEPVDIGNLPYGDGSYDVVLCSETLEHVTDIKRASQELLRVARNAVIITVPHESPAAIERYKRQNIPHAHLHSIGPGFFDFALPSLPGIRHMKTLSPLLRRPGVLVDACPVALSNNWKDFYKKAYNRTIPLFKILFGRKAAGLLLRLDALSCRLFNAYSGQVFILVKNAQCWQNRAMKKISPFDVMDFSVPLYHLSVPRTI